MAREESIEHPQNSVFFTFRKIGKIFTSKIFAALRAAILTKIDDFSRVFTTKSYLLHASPPQARKFWCFPLFYWKNLRFSSDFANIFSEIFSICNSRFSRIGKILKILPIFGKKTLPQNLWMFGNTPSCSNRLPTPVFFKVWGKGIDIFPSFRRQRYFKNIIIKSWKRIKNTKISKKCIKN